MNREVSRDVLLSVSAPSRGTNRMSFLPSLTHSLNEHLCCIFLCRYVYHLKLMTNFYLQLPFQNFLSCPHPHALSCITELPGQL